MKIELFDYNPNWHNIFLKEKSLLESVLPITPQIEHIRSTSIKNLCAKPIIDILCGINNFLHANELVHKIVAINYKYVEEYTALIPERRYFKKSGSHIHMVQSGGKFRERASIVS